MDAILGQEHAVGQLQSALASGRVHHAYIFHGPVGVGKFTAALAFGKILLCHKPQRDLVGRLEACGACESCRLFGKAGAEEGAAGGNHPDFHLVTKELALYSDDAQVRERKLMTIPIDVLRRALIEPIYRAAQLRHGKVMIVDEADLIRPNEQNVMLKALEEPPAGTVIVLLTASQDRLLPTLRSRCHRLQFNPIPDALVRQWAEREAADMPPAERQWLVEFAGGSLGRAVLAREYGLTAWSRDILPGVDGAARGRPPAGLGGQIAESINAFAEEWVKHHKNASKDAANRQAARLMWSMIARHASQRLAEAAGRFKPGQSEETEAGARPWLGVIDALTRAETELGSNVNLGVVADHAVAGMAGG